MWNIFEQQSGATFCNGRNKELPKEKRDNNELYRDCNHDRD